MFLKTDMVLVSFVFIGFIVHTSVAVTLKIAWLAPNTSVRTTVNSETSVGALKLALNMIEKNKILKGHSISIQYFPVTCEVNSVVGTVLGLRRTFKPDVIIGPPCQSGFETIGLLAADWNIPLLSWYNTGSELDDSTRYPTTLRLIPSVSFLGTVLINLVKQLQQNKLIVLHYQSNPWEPTKQSVVQEARQAGVSTIPVPVERGLSNKEMLQLISSVKGVPTLICPAELVRQIMLIAADLGMTDGNYVFIWLDPEMHVGSVLSDSGWKKGDNLDTKAETAYKHLMRVVYNPMYDATSPPVSTPTNKFHVFSRLVATRSQVNNPTWKLPVAGKPDIYSMYLYDAILFWSAVTNKLLKSNSKYRDGRIVAQEAKLFEARGASGFISLNKNLDRHGKVFVLKMAQTGIFKPVQIFRSSDQGTDHIILEPLGLTNIVTGKSSLQTSDTKDVLATGDPTIDTTTTTSPRGLVTTQYSPITKSKITTGKPTDKVMVSSLTASVNKSDKNASRDKQNNVSSKELNKTKADIIEKEATTQRNSPKTAQTEILEKEGPTQQITPITTPAEIVEKEVPAQHITPVTTQPEIVEKEGTTQQITPKTTPAEIAEKEVAAQQTTPVVAESTKLLSENKTAAVKYNSSTTKISSTTVKPTTTQKATETTSQTRKTTAMTLTQRQRQIWRQVMREHYQSMINTMREELGLPELMVPVAMLDNFIAQNRHLFDPTTTVPITSSVAPKTTNTLLDMGQPRKTFIIVNSNNLQKTMGTHNNNRLVHYLSKLIRNMSRNSVLAARIPPTTTTEYTPTEEPWWMA